jgi:hypothetical protein
MRRAGRFRNGSNCVIEFREWYGGFAPEAIVLDDNWVGPGGASRSPKRRRERTGSYSRPWQTKSIHARASKLSKDGPIPPPDTKNCELATRRTPVDFVAIRMLEGGRTPPYDSSPHDPA